MSTDEPSFPTRRDAGLAGGSGWVVLGLELDTGALRTVGCSGCP